MSYPLVIAEPAQKGDGIDTPNMVELTLGECVFVTRDPYGDVEYAVHEWQAESAQTTNLPWEIRRWENLAQSKLLTDAKEPSSSDREKLEELKKFVETGAIAKRATRSKARVKVEKEKDVAEIVVDLPDAELHDKSFLGSWSWGYVAVPTKLLRALSPWARAYPDDIRSFVVTFECLPGEEVALVARWICGADEIAYLRDSGVAFQIRVSVVAETLGLRSLQVHALSCLRYALVDRGHQLSCDSLDYVWMVTGKEDPLRSVLLQAMYVQIVVLGKKGFGDNSLMSFEEFGCFREYFASLIHRNPDVFESSHWWKDLLSFGEPRGATRAAQADRSESNDLFEGSRGRQAVKRGSKLPSSKVRAEQELNMALGKLVAMIRKQDPTHEKFLHILINDHSLGNNLAQMYAHLVQAKCLPVMREPELNIPAPRDPAAVAKIANPFSTVSTEAEAEANGPEVPEADLVKEQSPTGTTSNHEEAAIPGEQATAAYIIDGAPSDLDAAAEAETVPILPPSGSDTAIVDVADALARPATNQAPSAPNTEAEGRALPKAAMTKTQAKKAKKREADHLSNPAATQNKRYVSQTFQMKHVLTCRFRRSKHTVTVRLSDGQTLIDMQRLITASEVVAEVQKQQGDDFEQIWLEDTKAEHFMHFADRLNSKTFRWSRKSLQEKTGIASVAIQLEAEDIAEEAIGEIRGHVSSNVTPVMVDKVFEWVPGVERVTGIFVEALCESLRGQGIPFEDAQKQLNSEGALASLKYYWIETESSDEE
ncbi:hypothetical protein OHC33_005716 [Knufia fluminis]|uniref:Uncharacterized protein n=1 Tax=Knufia fluminis TaxID=191047 RepID=A0AAN8EDU6_9EURO|nr:hypothetical protein OHC33_005716 [Knufia fluminis]